jgi:hypothetical protein
MGEVPRRCSISAAYLKGGPVILGSNGGTRYHLSERQAMRVIGAIILFGASPAFSAEDVTFYKDIVPILQRRCQACHRPGEAAPMAFMTYDQVRPWAKAIREAVLLKKMPPWFADPHIGRFSNDRSLSTREIETFVHWVDGGARAGKKEQQPAPVRFVDGWNIGRPDAVLEMPLDFEVPATGAVEYQHFLVPTGFGEDRWIEALEMRPGNRAAVHHAAIFVRPPGSKWMPDLKAGVPYGTRNQRWFIGRSQDDELVGFYVPGGMPYTLKPGQAKLIKAGSDLIFQIHYTPNGKPGSDRSRVGFVFARKPPEQRIYSLTITNVKLVIPPMVADFPFQAAFTLPREVTLVAMNPHMHVRGKSFEFRAVFPNGENQLLLRVPNYSFNWQLYYYLANETVLPKGTRIECHARYDNSPNNPLNPDPRAEVRWGDQTWEEMLVGTVELGIPPGMDLSELVRLPLKPTD